MENNLLGHDQNAMHIENHEEPVFELIGAEHEDSHIIEEKKEEQVRPDSERLLPELREEQ